ncbi:elongation factor 1-beta-like [Argiope bruennichi]|uniref:Elongation factor 1-beta n=1 Tax=Argiope bruennichi TaxID=94029 RepID=A0A8T0FER9_ARGBR|nr:elongation factor 1-beta-like [Argiope bruennichi]KAF8788812.1 Elongation factor 1-beta like protein [Argiope bruennichi]
MGFGDLKTNAGLKSLDEFLADNSYIEGFQPSQADTTVFQALKSPPNAEFPHALRWYNHIKSFGNGITSFPGVKKDISAFTDASSASPAKASKAGGDDDDLDLFGSDDEEDAEAEKLKQERLKQYAEKKSKKPGVIAKSSVVLDVKPWDDETDMAELEKCVRTVECDGLKWGASKLVPLAYGIKKLQIMCVVEDDKVSIDWLQEEIQNFEDYVQSVDIAAFQKI